MFRAVFDRLIEVNFSGEGRTTLKNSGRAAPRLTNVLGGAGRGKFVIHLRCSRTAFSLLLVVSMLWAGCEFASVAAVATAAAVENG